MPEIILSWAIFCLVFTILLGFGVGVMSMAPPEFALAKWCFSFSAFVAAARLGWWLAIEQTLATDNVKVALAAFILFGCIGILWTGSLRWVDNRQRAFFSSTAQRKVEQKQLEVSLTPKKQKHTAEYLEAIQHGKTLLDSCRPPNKPLPDLDARFEQWQAEVVTYLGCYYLNEYIYRFLNSHHLISPQTGIDTSIPDGNKETFKTLHSRIMMLKQFTEETNESTN